MNPDTIGKGPSASFFKMVVGLRWIAVPSSCQFASFGAITPPKTCLYLVALRHYRPTNFTKGLQQQHHVGIVCLTHKAKSPILLSTKREFLSIV